MVPVAADSGPIPAPYAARSRALAAAAARGDSPPCDMWYLALSVHDRSQYTRVLRAGWNQREHHRQRRSGSGLRARRRRSRCVSRRQAVHSCFPSGRTRMSSPCRSHRSRGWPPGARGVSPAAPRPVDQDPKIAQTVWAVGRQRPGVAFCHSTRVGARPRRLASVCSTRMILSRSQRRATRLTSRSGSGWA
jgi:hypothetical protein